MLPSYRDKARLWDISEACKDILLERIWVTAKEHIEDLLKNVNGFLEE